MFFAFFLLSFLLVISVQAADNSPVALEEPTSFETLPQELQKLILSLLIADGQFVDVYSVSLTSKGWNAALESILHDESGDYVYVLVCKLMSEVEVKADDIDAGKVDMFEYYKNRDKWASYLQKIWHNLKVVGVPEVALSNIAEKLVMEQFSESEIKCLQSFIDYECEKIDSNSAVLPFKEFILPIIRRVRISPTHNLVYALLWKYFFNDHQGAFELFREAYEFIPGVKEWVVRNNGGSELNLDSIDREQLDELLTVMNFAPKY